VPCIRNGALEKKKEVMKWGDDRKGEMIPKLILKRGGGGGVEGSKGI
jgi:hypothetical protein